VSPVIGVVMMAAIVVVLASVVGTFALGLGAGASGESPPQVRFHGAWGGGTADCSLGSGATLTVTHRAGDAVEASTLSVTDGSSTLDVAGDCSVSGAMRAGGELTVAVDPSATVRIRWTEPVEGPGRTVTLGRWHGPDA
jgi:FlaG/FlaF family flagellin (archaellin)